MIKVISSSELRAGIKRILNEVGCGQNQYIVERFGEPMAAVISIDDLCLLQAIKQQRAKTSLREIVTSIRARGNDLGPGELNSLIEEARFDFLTKRN